jgi:hypothetical protein
VGCFFKKTITPENFNSAVKSIEVLLNVKATFPATRDAMDRTFTYQAGIQDRDRPTGLGEVDFTVE